jgi:DNA-binding transcriptional regulator YdaS (Cro superfamily)
MKHYVYNVPMDIFEKLNNVFESQSALARILGVEPMTVSQWKARRRIPAERCRAIVLASEGKITLAELRPDLYDDPSQAA